MTNKQIFLFQKHNKRRWFKSYIRRVVCPFFIMQRNSLPDHIDSKTTLWNRWACTGDKLVDDYRFRIIKKKIYINIRNIGYVDAEEFFNKTRIVGKVLK